MRGRLGAALALLALLGGACARPAVHGSHSAPAPAQPAPVAQTEAVPVSRGASSKASPSELRLVQALMVETERLRGLRFLGPVEVTLEDRIAMRAYVEHAIDDAQLARATRRYLALGALDPQTDIRALLVSVMEEELVGYYDPIEKRLAVRADMARALGGTAGEPAQRARGSESSELRTRDQRSLTLRATIVHELVHALQDQHFALGEKIEQLRSTDADNAFGALIEGDATLVMLAYTAEQAGSSLAALTEHPGQILSVMSRAPEQLTGALRRAPALLREPLLFRYREGAHFCAELHRVGGWSEVDRAHRAPPRTTSSIRHAERFVARASEPELPLPVVAPLIAQGFVQVDEDTLGALELSVLLGVPEKQASAIVDAWRGDRYVVLEKAGALASVWQLRMSNATAARSVAAAFEKLADRARTIVRSGAFVFVTRGLDAAAFGSLGGDPLASTVHRH